MAFVVTSGALAATDNPRAAAPYSLTLSSGDAMDYATIWRTQPQVRTVVAFIARNIAQLRVHHFRRISDNDRKREAESAVSRILARPNPHTTRYRMFDALVNDLGIYDVGYWAKVRSDDDAPGALLRLDPRQVKPLGDNPFTPDGFELRGRNGTRELKAEDVIYFRGYNPTDPRGGCPPIEALRQLLVEEWQANAYREQLWRNGARMSGYLSRPVDAPKWSDNARERFRREWQAQYTGDGPNAGGTPILSDGITFTAQGVTPLQAQYIEARKLTREEVAAAYHVPLPMVGLLDHATFSNIREQHKQLYMDCLGPWLEMIVEELTLQLLPEFDDTSDTYLEFNLAAKMAGSFEEQAAQLSASVGGPWMTRNEARSRQNLPAVDGGDELITPLNVVTGAQASPADSVPAPYETDPGKARQHRRQRARQARVKAAPSPDHVDRATDVLAAFFARQGAAIASAVGEADSKARRAREAGRKSDEPDVSELWDDDRWNGELAADLFGLNLAIASSCALATLTALGEDVDDYDEDRTVAWLTANAAIVAGAVNGATKRRLIDVLASSAVGTLAGAVTDMFAGYVGGRAGQLARSHSTSIAGFGTSEAARQTGRETTKTWHVRSNNPRQSHKRMDGETVPLDSEFSNGAKWPGDSSLDEDERAGCTCEIDVTFAD